MLNEAHARAYLTKLEYDSTPAPTKESLDALIYGHQTHIPFSTLDIHRSQREPDLELEAIFEKVVTQGKGGYCFELNKLFEALLTSLGYDARPVYARAVRGREGRMPINHRGMVVGLEDGLYSVDVGFGGPMPAGALKLEQGLVQDIQGESYIAEQGEESWWKIDRITKGHIDLHDDGLPTRRQTELELCTAPVEDIDFAALSLFCAQPGTLFRDHEVINLRTPTGHKAYTDGVLTIREQGAKRMVEYADAPAQEQALWEHFGIRCS